MTSTAAERQREIFQAMTRQDFYPHPVTDLQQRDTHISKVFLTGPYVYKIKKPVDLEFLDYTTLEKRRHFCHQEVALNRRLTDNVYLDVVAITLKNDRYVMAGPGSPVEYCVKMRQLPEESSMLRQLEAGRINKEELEALARMLARFYDRASAGDDITAFGSWETVCINCEENFRQTEPFLKTILDDRVFHIVRAATRSFLKRRKELFARRMDEEKIRDCHGDLRSGHIYFEEGIQIVDCIEFNDRFRYGDITSDLAFLAMDLDYEGYAQSAQDLLRAYVGDTQDHDVFALLDFYKCYRAFVRIKVNCLRLQQGDLPKEQKNRLLEETGRYTDLAYQYAVQFTRPTLWVICGMPASGKSTIAQNLAESLDIKVFSSDRVRKALFGLQPQEQIDLPFEAGIYSKEASSLTYGKLLLQAQEELHKGRSVILDATYASRHHRSEVLRLANDTDANVMFVECLSSEPVLKERLIHREKTSSLSDARLHHFDKMKALFEPLDEVPDDVHIRIDTEGSLDGALQEILPQDNLLLPRQTAQAVGQNGM
ncbi:MAG: AAA family ATPase [Thermodesulfobacteriota bacterium]|nr:AAA family ATPase [Thermodesulfobacteriota bacterium]